MTHVASAEMKGGVDCGAPAGLLGLFSIGRTPLPVLVTWTNCSHDKVRENIEVTQKFVHICLCGNLECVWFEEGCQLRPALVMDDFAVTHSLVCDAFDSLRLTGRCMNDFELTIGSSFVGDFVEDVIELTRKSVEVAMAQIKPIEVYGRLNERLKKALWELSEKREGTAFG